MCSTEVAQQRTGTAKCIFGCAQTVSALKMFVASFFVLIFVFAFCEVFVCVFTNCFLVCVSIRCFSRYVKK
jgi:hypothetical protein